MYNVNFGTEQQPVMNNYNKETPAQSSPTTQTQPRIIVIPNNNQPVQNQQGRNTMPAVERDTFSPAEAAAPRTQTPNTPQRTPYYFPMVQRQPQKKFDWDNFYRIAGLATSVVLTILIALSLKPMIGRYFKKNSSDLFIDLNKNVIDFDKLPGMKEPKQELIDKVINPIKYKDLYESENLDLNLFCILYGPPGTGKTNFVYSAAKKLNAKVAEFKLGKEGSGIINETANNLQAKADAIIAHAKKNPDQEYFVLFDEVESILSEIKNPTSGADHERAITIKTFLQIMDDFLPYKNIKVFATTNMTRNSNTGNIGNMNPAAMNRFGTKIYVGNPDIEAIESALKLYLGEHPMAKKLLENKEDIAEIAASLLNSSYRELNNIIKNAVNKTMKQKINAVIKGKNPKNTVLTKETFMEAIRDFERTNKKLGGASDQVAVPRNPRNMELDETILEDMINMESLAEGEKQVVRELTPEELKEAKRKLDVLLNNNDKWMNP